jgi:hypothetical protein
MNAKLFQMAQAAEKSATLQATSAENEFHSLQNEEKAAADQAEAAELEEEATLLFEKSEADAALAAAEQVEIDELEAEIVVEEEETVTYAAAAALDEVTFESEMAEGIADAAEAARMEAQAHGEEVGIGICEFFPLFDVICDLVGGVTAVGLELSAATETLKASGELAAAAAAKAVEEREVAIAAEIQAKALEDAALAGELQGEELETEELAEEERLEAEEKEATAEALFEQAEVGEESAAEESGLSAEEEADATSLAGEAIFHGVLSCWDAIMASIFGILSFSFFTARMATKFIVPAARQSCALVIDLKSTRSGRKNVSSSVWRYISHFLHHCGLFLLVAGIFQNILPGLGQNSLRSRGGIILCFGFIGSCVQTTLLHSIPHFLAKTQARCQMFLHATRQMIVLTLLFVIEILTVWVNFGPQVFTQSRLHALGEWWLWIVFLVPLTFHILILEMPMLKRERSASDCSSATSTEKDDLGTEPEIFMTPSESDYLLPIDKNSLRQTRKKSDNLSTSWFSLLHQEIKNLQLPFEALILSCMIGVILHCISSTHSLWPASKALLLSTRPGWLIPFAFGFTVLGFCFVAFSVKNR